MVRAVHQPVSALASAANMGSAIGTCAVSHALSFLIVPTVADFIPLIVLGVQLAFASAFLSLAFASTFAVAGPFVAARWTASFAEGGDELFVSSAPLRML